jgi:hypothetical protein
MAGRRKFKHCWEKCQSDVEHGSLRDENGQVLISVSDTSVGLPPQ